MPRIVLRTEIHAPVERCFDLSRSIDLHQHSTARTEEKAISGRTNGLISLDERVTWEATHLGFRQRLTSRITAFEYPDFFVDEMEKGIFKSLYHLHRFHRHGEKTIMEDDFRFTSPFGFLGRIADTLFLTRYLKQFLLERNQVIKEYAEGNGWKSILPSISAKEPWRPFLPAQRRSR